MKKRVERDFHCPMQKGAKKTMSRISCREAQSFFSLFTTSSAQSIDIYPVRFLLAMCPLSIYHPFHPINASLRKHKQKTPLQPAPAHPSPKQTQLNHVQNPDYSLHLPPPPHPHSRLPRWHRFTRRLPMRRPLLLDHAQAAQVPGMPCAGCHCQCGGNQG
jgi:hypothetical protein